ncbi:MAG TPA: CoA transferase [Candidatus Binataceae bacterium]|nr:CoA transferase [Candidatus Binataceae bacterium]
MATVFDRKIRVLDLSMGWAGPLVGQMLAEMGAEVIKVEDTHYFDWWRGSLSMAAPEAQPIERASTFNTANRGKLGVTLDLLNPRGIELVKRLAAHADILIENYSAGVMERFGLSYEILAPLNPRLIMISMPSFGYGGPETYSRGYGNTLEAMAGVTGLVRYHDSEQPYTLSNALGDPVGGLTGTFGILAAFYEREKTGRGQWIELAQVEGVIPMMAGQILEYQLTGQAPLPRGNRHPDFAPHGIFRCGTGSESEEAWIALAAASDDQWRALARVLGLARLESDPRFSDPKSRKRNEDALDAEIGRALAALAIDEAVARLSAAGVYAAHVNSAPAVLGDSQLQERGYFVPVERAVVGTHLYPGAVARMSATPAAQGAPAPLLGEHNAQVFRGLLGMTEAELAELESAGVIGSAPRDYRKAS